MTSGVSQGAKELAEVVNELVTMVIDNLVELLLEQEAEVSLRWQ